MNRVIPILAAVATAAALSACAGIGDFRTGPKYAKLESIHAGLTQADVRSLAGPPDVATGANSAGGELWIYETMNEFGELAEYDVDFDTAGTVRDVTSFNER